MLSFTASAVTVAEADAYAASRGLTWSGDNTAKTAALRRGQDYIAGEYNRKWLVGFTDATAPDVVKYAIVEAATREITTPFGLTPDVRMGSAKVLTGLDTLKWTPLKSDPKAADMKPTIFAIRGLLSGVAAMGDMPSAFVV
jgi:hypothetical protein